jgi:hypothetical protein
MWIHDVSHDRPPHNEPANSSGLDFRQSPPTVGGRYRAALGLSGYNLCEFDCAARNVSNLCCCKNIGPGERLNSFEPKTG